MIRPHIDVVHSPHDGGWYAQLWNKQTGADIYVSAVFPTQEEAKEAVREWWDIHGQAVSDAHKAKRPAS